MHKQRLRLQYLPSGKLTVCYGKIHHFLWVNPLYMAMFNSYVSLPEIFFIVGKTMS